MQRRRGFELNSSNTIVTIVFLILAFVALFWLARSLFAILSWAAPILLIATLIMDYRIVLNYGKWILKLFKTNVLGGIAASVLTVLGFPIVSLLLFGRAMLERKTRQMREAYEAERNPAYTDYEVIEEHETLELPHLEKRILEQDEDEYEQLFD